MVCRANVGSHQFFSVGGSYEEFCFESATFLEVRRRPNGCRVRCYVGPDCCRLLDRNRLNRHQCQRAIHQHCKRYQLASCFLPGSDTNFKNPVCVDSTKPGFFVLILEYSRGEVACVKVSSPQRSSFLPYPKMPPLSHAIACSINDLTNACLGTFFCGDNDLHGFVGVGQIGRATDKAGYGTKKVLQHAFANRTF